MNTFDMIGEAHMMAVHGRTALARMMARRVVRFWRHAMRALTWQARSGDLPL